MNGTVALDENIADSAGVQIAFQAYKDAANINESLPNIDLSNDQVFFVSFGQVREDICVQAQQTNITAGVVFAVHYCIS